MFDIFVANGRSIDYQNGLQLIRLIVACLIEGNQHEDGPIKNHDNAKTNDPLKLI